MRDLSSKLLAGIMTLGVMLGVAAVPTQAAALDDATPVVQSVQYYPDYYHRGYWGRHRYYHHGYYRHSPYYRHGYYGRGYYR